MKLNLNETIDGKNYLEVSIWSFWKCSFISQLVVFGLIFGFFFLLGIIFSIVF